MPEQKYTAPTPLDRAMDALLRAETAATDSTPATAQAWASIGAGWAALAQTSQQHLLAMIHQYQALVALTVAGLETKATTRAMQSLEDRITKGLGL